MSNWSTIGLPLPQKRGYSYELNPGLLRTSFATAHPRQDDYWKNARRTFTCNFLLTHDELKAAESFIRSSGYTWFTISLYSGIGTELQDHTVRMVTGPKVSILGKGVYSLSLSLETQFAIDAPDLTSITCLDPIPCTAAEADNDPC